MADDTPFDDEDTADERLRPPWEDTPDETDADRRPRRRHPSASGDGDWRAGADLPVLLTALADASDALARLDARVAAADDAVRDGLLRAPRADRGRRVSRPQRMPGCTRSIWPSATPA